METWGEPQSNTPSSILWFLSLFDRPRNAVASAAQAIGTDNNPLGAAWRGLSGQTHTSWGDVFGWEPTRETDTWGDYLAKGTPRLAADIVLDPLNLIGGLGLGGKGASLAGTGLRRVGLGAIPDKLMAARHATGEWLYGSPLGKAFGHRLPERYTPQEMDIQRIQREGAEAEINRLAQGTGKEIDRILAERGMTAPEIKAFRENQLYQGIERPGTVMGVDDAIQDIVSPMRAKGQAQIETMQELAKKLDIEEGVPGLIKGDPSYQYWGRSATPTGEYRLGKIRIDPDVYHAESREIYNWVNAEGKTVTTGKFEDPRTRVWQNEHGEYMHGSTPVYREQATKLEAERFYGPLVPDPTGKLATGSWVKGPKGHRGEVLSINGPDVTVRFRQKNGWFERTFKSEELRPLKRERIWEPDPIQAQQAVLIKNQRKVNYLETIDTFLENGWLHRLDDLGDVAPESVRQLRIKGLDRFAADPVLANRLENLGQALYHTTDSVNEIERLLSAAWKTPIGKHLQQAQNIWKAGVLAWHPGFHTANLVSAATETWLSGLKNPLRIEEAGLVKASGLMNSKPVVKGYTNRELRQEFANRGIIDQFGPSQAGGLEGTKTLGLTELLGDQLAQSKTLGRVGSTAGSAINQTGDALWNFHMRGYKVAGDAEDLFRLAPALDWLKKNVKHIPTAEDLDRAVHHAIKFTADAGELTYLEKSLRNYVPFYSWWRHILGRTMMDVLDQPQKLADLGRVIDFALTPLTTSEQQDMPEWMRGKGAARGIAGGRWTSQAGDPVAFQAGRFIPQGNIEQLMDNWRDTALSAVSPMLKFPLELGMNYSASRKRPIDDIASSRWEALTGWIPGLGSGQYAKTQEPWLGVHPPAAIEAMVSQSPAGRYVSELNNLLKGTIWEDRSKTPMTGGEKAFWYATGGKATPYDLEQSRYWKGRREHSGLANIRRAMGHATNRGDLDQAEFYRDMLMRRMQQQPWAMVEAAQ